MTNIRVDRSSPSRLLAASLALVAQLASSAAFGQACPTPTAAAPVVYVTGGGKVILQDLAKVLAATGVTVIYKQQGSCLALDAVVNGTKLTGTATYWDATTALTCDLDPAGVVVDIGISDVFPTTCSNLPGGLPNTVKDFFGPIEAYAFVAPTASPERSISMAAAYSIYGFGKDSGVEPWTDEAQIFTRDADSGTQQMMAAAIAVPATQWKGTGTASSTAMITALTTAPNPERALGILTTEIAGENELSLRVLAYQAEDQLCGYYPDSTPTSNDKRNVRDGHYWIWGPLHFLSQVDANNYPLNPNAKEIINILTGTKEPPAGLDLIKLLATTHIVPACAMTVKRDSELGPLMSYQPTGACGCYFEQQAIGTNDCAPCVSAVECPEERPACNYGFCEYQ